MTAVERARKFIVGRGRTIALTIVPLASLTLAAATQAKAGAIFAFTSSSCNASGGTGLYVSGSCSATTYLQAPPNNNQNGANAISVWTPSGVTAYSNSGGSASMTVQVSGYTNSGSLSGSTLPLNWDFVINSFDLSNAQYDLTYTFGSNSYSTGETALSFQSGSASVDGSTTLTFDSSNIDNYSITLDVSGTLTSGGSFTLDIPQTVGGAPASIDVNAVQSATPEPASVALGAMGLAALFLARFRRRKISTT